MKLIIQTILAIAFLALVLCLPARSQTNGTNGNISKPSAQDSVKKVQQENQKLYMESFTINAALIDSAIKRIEGFITMKDIKEQTDRYKYYESCNAFVNALFEMWLENRKKKK